MEIWRPIPDYPGYYASSLGRIKTIKNPNRGGNKKIILKAIPNHRNKYMQVHIHPPGPRNYANLRSVHVLVLSSFFGKPLPGQQALHKDNNRANNALNNLRWGTKLENENQKILDGKIPSGENHYNAKLNNTLAKEIRRFHGLGAGISTMARHLKLSCHAVRRVVNGKGWIKI